MANKKAKVLEELEKKSRSEQAAFINDNVQGKRYSKGQFKTLTNAFMNDNEMLQVIIESLRVLKESTTLILDKHERAFNAACSVAEKAINNPNSTEQERINAIKLINNCYRMLTAVNGLVIIAIVAVIIIILKAVFGVAWDDGKQKK